MSERERHVGWDDPRRAIAFAIEHRLSGLDFLRAMQRGEIPSPPVARLIGFEIDEVEPGRVVFGLQPSEHHYNPNGVVHGGIAAALLDTVTGCAVTTLLPFGETCATLELKVNYIRSLTATSPRVVAEGTVLHRGQRSAVAEGKLLLPDGRLAAHATSTLMIFPPDQSHGRHPEGAPEAPGGEKQGPT